MRVLRAEGVLSILLFLAGMLSLFRHWLPWFGLGALGGEGDGAITRATLEHWWHVSIGSAQDWKTPGWFWPARNTLGLTDTYVLFAVPYAIARGIGLSMSCAFDCSIAVFAVAGYWGFIALMRGLGARLGVAAAFGFVFAFGSLVTMKLGHAQTYTIMLAPILGLLLLAAWRRSGWPSACYTSAAALVFCAITLTAPQTGWFLALESAIVAVIFRMVTPRHAWVEQRRRLAMMAAGGAVGCLLGAIPVALVYAGTSKNHRSWHEVQTFMPRLTDVVNVQSRNVLWHHILYLTGISNTNGRPVAEIALGFTPTLLVVAVLSLLYVSSRQRARPDTPMLDALALACLATPFIAWLLTAEVKGHSLWWFIYRIVPGGSGIRTPFRIQLASLFFMCCGVSYAVSAWAASRRHGSARSHVLVAGALALCVVEQANGGPSYYDDRASASWLSRAGHPPPACRAFYLLPYSGTDRLLPWPIQQPDAMLLSQVTGLPTVNGNSSWYPPGWQLFEPNRPEYFGHLRHWLDDHPVAGICGVAPREGRWTVGIPAT